MQCEQAQSLLDRYIDDELHPSQAQAYRRHLVQCRACQHRLDERRALQEAVQQASRAHAPAALRARVLALTESNPASAAVSTRASTPAPPVASMGTGDRRATPRRYPLATAIAGVSVALAVAAGALGYRLAPQTPSLPYETVASYIRARLSPAGALGVVASDTHTVKPWLVGKLDYAPPVPNLAAHGFVLAGARLDYAAARTVAVAVYRRRAHAIDLFVWPSARRQAPRAYAVRGYRIIEWAADDMHYVAVSDLNAAELGEFAAAVRNAVQR